MANSTKPRAKPLPFWLALGKTLARNTKNRIQNASRQLREQRVSHYQGEIVRLEVEKLEQQKAFTKEVVDSFEGFFNKPEFQLTQSEKDRLYNEALEDRDFHLPDWVDRSKRDLMVALYTVHDPTKLSESMRSNETLMKQLQEVEENWDQKIAEINQYGASIKKAQELLGKAEEALNPSQPKNRENLPAKVAAFRSRGLDKMRMPRIFNYQATLERKTKKAIRRRDRGLNQFKQIASDHLDRIAKEHLSGEDFGKLQADFNNLQESNPKANYVDFMAEHLREQLEDEKAKQLVNQIYNSYIKDTNQFTQAYQRLKESYAGKGTVYQDTLKQLGELHGFPKFVGRLGARLTTYAKTKPEFDAAKAALKPPKEKVEARAR